MAFVKGQKGGPGRPKGAKNKKDEMIASLTQQAIDGGLTPLDFFLSNLRNDQLPLGFRHENAKAAAPYCHRKMPIAIENADAPFKVFDMSSLVGLNDEELAVVEKLMSKAQERALREDAADARRGDGPMPPPKPRPPKRGSPGTVVDTPTSKPASKFAPKKKAR